MLSSTIALFISLLLPDCTRALRVPLEARSREIRADSIHRGSRLRPRANTTVSIQSASNTEYTANITVGGAPFAVILDTGSSDLWITGNVPSMTDLGQSTTVKYAVGQASGQINSAQVDFAGHSVPDQAFIYVQDAAATGLDTTQFNGILGLGPSVSSEVHSKLQQAGDPFLDQVFRQNTSTPNYITFLLERQGDAADTIQGQFTIGEIVSGYESITNQPKVPVKALPGPFQSSQHWSGLIDEIKGPDGQSIKLDSLVPGTPSGSLVGIFDSGFTLPQVPRDVSDAIYGRVQGANYDTTDGYWTVPCDQEVNITVVIGGQDYPINPLDTASSDVHAVDSNGNTVCVGTFQPISSSLDGTFDAIMGMAFLRNTYTYINFGDFVDGNPQNQGNPYVQLLSVTDPAKAHQDFVKSRMNNVDSSGDSAHSLVPSGQEKHSPSSSSEKAENAFFRYWPYIVGVLGLLMAIGVVWLIFSCFCRRSRRLPQSDFDGRGYKPLHGSSSTTAVNMQPMGTPRQGAYADPYYRGPQY